MTMSKAVQAKDISDADVMRAIDSTGGPSMRSELEKRLARFPAKVLNAKLRSMLRRGLITGCACGCRGDFERREPK